MSDSQLPVPPVPADCNLRGLPWMPVDTVRLLDSDIWALSTPEEFKAAFRLWCKAWQQVPASSLPDNDQILSELSGAGRRWSRLRTMALRGFVKCSDGRLYHPVIAEKAIEAWQSRDAFLEKNANKSTRQQRWRERQKQLSEQLRELGVTPPVGASLSTLKTLLVDTKASTVDAPETPKRGRGTGRETGKEEKDQPLRGLSGEAPDASHPDGKNGHDQIRTRELRKQAIEILGFLNEKTGRAYQPVPANVDMIVARLKQGATVDDCRAVIAKKCREWAGDEKMAPYLRPATLFNAQKFANYQGELGTTGAPQ